MIASPTPAGLFAEWQPRYAEHGIATFPVRDKRPAVRGYLKVGLRASGQFVLKFPLESAFGLSCRKSGITVLDIDAPDERLLADAMSEVGASPFIVRSGSGNFQAWYRHNGEGRLVRPNPERPIDILGDGFVVAPPSTTAKGSYSIIQGALDDLGRLPPMRHSLASKSDVPELIDEGRRNENLWRVCMKQAPKCSGITEMMEFAMHQNASLFFKPLPDDEVMRVVASAWAKELSGDNWFGRGGRVVVDAGDVDGLLREHPDAFVLLTILRRHHWGSQEFVVANGMAATMPGGGWRRERFAAARQTLIAEGRIWEVRPASRHSGPAIYRFKGAQL